MEVIVWMKGFVLSKCYRKGFENSVLHGPYFVSKAWNRICLRQAYPCSEQVPLLVQPTMSEKNYAFASCLEEQTYYILC